MSEKKHILIVEDNNMSAKILSKKLGDEYTCKIVNNGESALKWLNENHTDIVLLDLIMPGLTGLEVLEEVRKNYQALELPIIIVTTKEEDEVIGEVFSYGANDYLKKPVRTAEARERIKTHLRMVSLYQENLKYQEADTVRTMIVTYNHEIKNPLAIVKATVNGFQDINPKNAPKVSQAKEAIIRINSILDKIQKLNEDTEKKKIPYYADRKRFKIG